MPGTTMLLTGSLVTPVNEDFSNQLRLRPWINSSVWVTASEISPRIRLLAWPCALRLLVICATLSSERFKGVVLKLSSDQVEVSFTNPEVGEGQEMVPLFMEAGDPAGLPLEVGFNARYFLEPLNAMESEMARKKLLTFVMVLILFQRVTA